MVNGLYLYTLLSHLPINTDIQMILFLHILAHLHTYTHIRGNLGLSILPEGTSKCGLEEPGSNHDPSNLWATVCHLSHSHYLLSKNIFLLRERLHILNIINFFNEHAGTSEMNVAPMQLISIQFKILYFFLKHQAKWVCKVKSTQTIHT